MKLKAKIYRPAKTAMQSGRAKSKFWWLEYEPLQKSSPEPLMGWISGGTLQQVKLKFDTEAEAIAYAKEKNIDYEVVEPHERILKPRAYASNFAWDKRVAF